MKWEKHEIINETHTEAERRWFWALRRTTFTKRFSWAVDSIVTCCLSAAEIKIQVFRFCTCKSITCLINRAIAAFTNDRNCQLKSIFVITALIWMPPNGTISFSWNFSVFRSVNDQSQRTTTKFFHNRAMMIKAHALINEWRYDQKKKEKKKKNNQKWKDSGSDWCSHETTVGFP